MNIDPYILAFSLVTVAVTVWMGFRSAKKSKTASDFFVAGRSVGVGMNASAISGEYLSAASFMGIAGMVMSSGYDALWYPVCYACGYLFLLLFIAGPLRRFGAYTIPDFAEGRFDSPVFRKIAVVFVLFIGFFYTMPQMKGAGTTLAYIFQDVDLRGGFLEFLAPHSATGEAIKGFPYWAGVLIVGAVITLNVALGGMKGITLVQAFQYWIKMFAISVPIFVLMAVYGHYGKQVGANGGNFEPRTSNSELGTNAAAPFKVQGSEFKVQSFEFQTFASALRDSMTWQERLGRARAKARGLFQQQPQGTNLPVAGLIRFQSTDGDRAIPTYEALTGRTLLKANIPYPITRISYTNSAGLTHVQAAQELEAAFAKWDWHFLHVDEYTTIVSPRSLTNEIWQYVSTLGTSPREPLPAKAPADATWLNPFGPLTTKAAKTAAAAIGRKATNTVGSTGYQPVPPGNLPGGTGATPLGSTNAALAKDAPPHSAGQVAQQDGLAARSTQDTAQRAERAWLAKHEKPLALLYTYSLIIAIVCGTAGLPHILVRFYTNPDGAAAKRTTMWVMILIGVFYVFPPVFGVIGRNLLPDLYNGIGAKGTDKIVLELPRLLNEKYPPLGSILSGITCAGAFAAFMSTFSGLLVSMTGALAHDVYGRILRPKSTPEQRMRMFKIGAVIIGGVAVLLGSFVEKLEINFMVGQAFAIAASSYFPLLFMAVWWRRLTMLGAATGMLTGGLLAVASISLTSFSTLAAGTDKLAMTLSAFKPLNTFWAEHPLLRIICEQPAIWAVPLAIVLMIVVSKLTPKTIPADSRMKMLVLHAPEQLGLKQEYIQEHQAGAGH